MLTPPPQLDHASSLAMGMGGMDLGHGHLFASIADNGRALAATPATAASEFRRATVLDATSYQAWYHLANNLLQADKAANLKEAIAAYVRVCGRPSTSLRTVVYGAGTTPRRGICRSWQAEG